MDGLGNPVSTNTSVGIEVIIVSGLTNFPIWDAECNPDGFIVDAIRPSLPQPRLYFDDTQLGGANNTVNGCVSPCHSWGNANCTNQVGNNVMVNTYWFATLKSQTFVDVYPNCPPVTAIDQATVESGSQVIVPVVTNDRDPNDDIDPGSVTVPAALSPQWGSINSIDPVTGSITYQAQSGFEGTDTFQYVICDDGGACDTGIVVINVTCASPPMGFEINGYVYYDYAPVNMVRDAFDAGIGGAVVDIYNDVNQNGMRDGGDIRLASAVTEGDGFYSYQAMGTTVSFTRRVSNGIDDAEEDFGGNNLGNLSRGSNDLDLGEGYTNGPSPTFVGIRFRDVQVPQGGDHRFGFHHIQSQVKRIREL